MHKPEPAGLALLLPPRISGPRSRLQQPHFDHATQPIRWNKVWLPLALVIAGWLVLPADLWVAQWSLANNCPDPLDKWLTLSEVFAHGLGVIAILAVVAVLDPARRVHLPRLIVASLGTGLVANGCKLLIARVRPHSFTFEGGPADTFHQWFPWLNYGSEFQGFPSAHMATAAGLAMGLAWLYPRGRFLFLLLAISAGGQRIVSGDHFASDVVWGAALGCFCATGLFDGGLLASYFDRLERRWRPCESVASEIFVWKRQRPNSAEVNLTAPTQRGSQAECGKG
jgi:membrane-associated phospholipid phosphatase